MKVSELYEQHNIPTEGLDEDDLLEVECSQLNGRSFEVRRLQRRSLLSDMLTGLPTRILCSISIACSVTTLPVESTSSLSLLSS